MSEETPSNRTNSNDEIDLIDLFRRMGRTIQRWLSAFGKAILISAVFLVRNWLFLLLSIILGTGAAYLIKKAAKPVYSSDMVLEVNVPSTSEMISYLNRLHTFCAGNNNDELARVLVLDNQKINHIVDISAFWIIDNGRDSIPDYVDYTNKHDVYDTVNVRMKDRLDIRVQTEAAEDLTQIEEKILMYLKSNELFRQRNELRLKQTEEMISRLEFDIKELDSLQKIKYFQESENLVPRSGGQMVFLQEQKTQLLYSDIHKLYTKKQKLEQLTGIYKDMITVISDFTVPSTQANNIFYYIKSIVPAFFILTLLILIVITNRRKILDIYHKY